MLAPLKVIVLAPDAVSVPAAEHPVSVGPQVLDKRVACQPLMPGAAILGSLMVILAADADAAIAGVAGAGVAGAGVAGAADGEQASGA